MKSAFTKTFANIVLVGANMGLLAHSATPTVEPPKLYSLKLSDSQEVSLLDVIEDMPKYFNLDSAMATGGF